MKCKYAIKKEKQINCSKIDGICMFLEPDEKKCRQLNEKGPIIQSKPKTTQKIIKSKSLAFGLSWLKFEYSRDYQGNYIFEKSKKFEYAWDKINALRKELQEWEEK